MISSARLGATTRTSIRGGDAQSFEINLELVGVPATGISAVQAGTEVK